VHALLPVALATAPPGSAGGELLPPAPASSDPSLVESALPPWPAEYAEGSGFSPASGVERRSGSVLTPLPPQALR
jgi:hypothetical protein